MICANCIACVGDQGFLFHCNDELKSTLTSPDRKLSAAIFKRNCGATTGYTTHVSLIKALEESEMEISKASNTIAIVDNSNNIDIKWRSNNELHVIYKDNEFYKKISLIKGIKIRYHKIFN